MSVCRGARGMSKTLLDAHLRLSIEGIECGFVQALSILRPSARRLDEMNLGIWMPHRGFGVLVHFPCESTSSM